MEEKLEKLLKQLEIKENNYSFFTDGKLNRIVGSKDKTTYVFEICLKNILPLDLFLDFKEKLKNSFPSVENVKVDFIYEKKDNENIQEYYDFILKEFCKISPILKTVSERNIKIDENKLIVTVINKSEEMKVLSIKNNLEKSLKKVGFDIKIEIFLDEKESNKIREEINNNLLKETAEISKIEIKHKEDIIEEKKKYVPKEGYQRKPLIQEPNNKEVVIGRVIDTEVTHIESVVSENNNVTLEAHIYADVDVRETRTGLKILTVKFTDYTDSMYGKIFVNEEDELRKILSGLKRGKWYKIRGSVKDDKYSRELTLTIRDINILVKDEEETIDDAKNKRIELHTHSIMSQMDGVSSPKDLLSLAQKWGHKAIALTDHNGVQGFIEGFKFVKGINKSIEKEEDKFKCIYGTELLMIDDQVDIIIRPNDTVLLDNTFVVFDVETTGFNAGGGDSIIEIGAVKIFNGEIIDRFDELINPGRKLPKKIIELTEITDEMLKDKDNEENAVKRFIAWYGDLPLVAHNAKFDISFLEMAMTKYDLGTVENTVIDTLELSRTLDNNYARHGLSALVKRYNVPWDETAHHRADYDAEGTALVFHKMLKKLDGLNLEKMTDLNKLVSKDEIHKYGRGYHINLLALNKAGLKNLFKIISEANTTYLYKTPRILRSKIKELRGGILLGSGCYESEVFREARTKSDEELTNIINFYDYVEVQPPECYDHLLQMGDFGSKVELLENIKKVIRVTKEAGKIMIATGDVHHLTKEDKIYREIIVNQKVPGGGRHPLARKNITEIASNHLRTTNEMLENFSFLDKDEREELVITNPNKIADMVEIIEVVIDTDGVPFSPKIENSKQIVEDMVYGKAKELYGNKLPEIIETRIEQELKGIIGGGFDVIYLISQKLVKKSNDDGYLVGSRGSVGSSFVATMMGITEVNPLPAHYMCPKCSHSIFEENGKPLGETYPSGFDLPDKECPNCKAYMVKEGNDMPFATFLGFNADKVPDIDLNFSGDYQWKAHEYTKELFGIDNVYRAGTIGTVADKTAFGFVKGYCEEKGISMRGAEIERLAMGCTGVKRTTGQHPGGIVVVPDYMDVFDFTPFQFPADDTNSLWRTTHFDYHAIDECLLKLDILGHVDPTHLKMLEVLSGMDVTKIPLDDKDTMKIFSSPKILGVTKEEIDCEVGTLGIPEFGTPFTLSMLSDTKPTTFAELIKISGLSHGTDVWLNNAQELIRKDVVKFSQVIGCRDDIMVYLMQKGMDPLKAFKIMEFVRKGMPSRLPDIWKEHVETMKEAGIDKWYIESCGKIKYMFPKAHATAYVTSAFRIAYFKVHHPLWYYASYFSVRCHDFDIESMIKGYDEINKKMVEIVNKGYEATNKENAVLETLKIAKEAVARGIKFANINIMESDAANFIINENNELVPPFRTIDGLGENVAKNIVSERKKAPFLSIEDLQKRAKISGTIIDKMRMMNLFIGWDESSQLSLF